MKKAIIIQSNYIPWKGYFDMIAMADEFIIYDDVQFTKNDWRNRNKIKTPKGTEWITIPVGQNINRIIREVRIENSKWQSIHWKMLCHNYKKAKYFKSIAEILEPLYLKHNYSSLSKLNRAMIEFVCKYLGIETRISNSWDYVTNPGKSERLIHLCKQVGVDEYISGPSAKNYLDESLFSEHGIKVTWFNYDNYPEYPQLWGEFRHDVSILDLLFNCGKTAPSYMKYVIKPELSN